MYVLQILVLLAMGSLLPSIWAFIRFLVKETWILLLRHARARSVTDNDLLHGVWYELKPSHGGLTAVFHNTLPVEITVDITKQFDHNGWIAQHEDPTAEGCDENCALWRETVTFSSVSSTRKIQPYDQTAIAFCLSEADVARVVEASHDGLVFFRPDMVSFTIRYGARKVISAVEVAPGPGFLISHIPEGVV